MSENILMRLFSGDSDEICQEDINRLFNIFPCMPSLDLISIVSAQYYEKRECKSKMIFIPETCKVPNSFLTQYITPVEFEPDNVRQLTKFLASTSDDNALVLVYNSNIYRVVGVSKTKKPVKDIYYSVKFNGHMNYSFFVGEDLLFLYENGKYKIPETNELDDLKNQLMKMNVDSNEIDVFLRHIKKLIKSKHGTTMVVSTGVCPQFCTKEVERLVKVGRGVAISPVRLFDDRDSIDDFLQKTSVADGGFLVDSEGYCHAIQVIFDGEIKSYWGNSFNGRSDRGSRFNSLLAYIFGKNTSCQNECKCNGCDKSCVRAFAIIISDDGMVNVIDNMQQDDSA